MGHDVQRQVGHDHLGNSHGPLARLGLGRPEGEPAVTRLAQLPGHADRSGLHVDVTSAQGHQLTPAQTAEYGEQDQGAIPGTGRVGPGAYLSDSQDRPALTTSPGRLP